MAKVIATISKSKLAQLASITIRTEPEDARIEGNASAIDPANDKLTEDWIVSELVRGNEWAWCRVIVTATYDGESAEDSLGCCSYKSESDFRRASGDFGVMRREALAALHEKLVERDRELPLRKVVVAEVAVSYRQAIVTKYSGHGKIAARSQAGRVDTAIDQGFSMEANHAAAARALAERYSWTDDPWVGAALPDGRSYCFVQVPASK